MITEKEAIDILTSPDEIYQDVDGLVGYTYNPKKRNYEAFQLAIKGLERLKEQTRWIPVNERLPKDFQRVLVTIVNYDGYKIVRVAEYHQWRDVFKIRENSEEWKVGEKGLLAWQPLPDPYE